MRRLIVSLILTGSLLSFHCSSSADKALIRHRIGNIGAWRIAYDSRIEPGNAPPASPGRVTGAQHVDRNLRFADLTSEILRNKYNIPIVPATGAECGRIQLVTGELPDGSPKYVEISLYDPAGRFITRKRVWNDAEAMTRMWYESQENIRSFNQNFAAYVAEKIALLFAGR